MKLLVVFGFILVCGSLCEQAVQINATPSSEYLLKDSKNNITVKLNISASLTTQVQNERPPFELAIVFDRSGSMYGDKIVHAKQSIKNIINNLTPKDRLHLVIYDDVVDVVFKDGTVEQTEELLKKVDQVYERGMTNLHGGLQRGYEMLSSSSKMVKRVFLFSDGLANSGITDPNTIYELAAKMHREQSISTSAFGIGVDFDEPLMTGIAEHGNGDYFFIGNGGDTEKVVSIGLKGVTNLVADNVKLRVRGKNGATVTKVFGFPTDSLREGAKLSDIRQHTKRTILLQLEVDTTKSLANDDILEYELEYQVIKTGQVEVIRGTLHVLFTDDRSLVDIKNVEIQELLELQLATEKEQEVRKALEEGDLQRAKFYNEEANVIYSRVASTSTNAEAVFQAQVRNKRNVQTMDSISTGNIKKAEMQTSYYSSKNILFDEADAEL